ncbi:MAG: hypothetical protein KA807_10260 [Prolixibacteraceae bacterium]|nr:hypothetical protein [Prolixibacteraceae bacterium]
MEYINNMKVGEVSRILNTEGNNFILYLDHVETIEINEKEKNKLKTELQLYKEWELDKEKEKEILKKGELKINNESLNCFLDYYSNKSIMKKNGEKIIAEYCLKGNNCKLSFLEFKDYLTFSPFGIKSLDTESIVNFLNQYFWDEYLKEEAKDLGLFNSDKFLLDQKNYKNNLLKNNYLKREIWDKIIVDSSRVKLYYGKNIDVFTKQRILIGDVYLFKEYYDALNSIPQIITELNCSQKSNSPFDIKKIPNLLNIKNDFLVEFDKLSIPEEIFSDIILNPNEEFYKKPIKMGNKYFMFYKKEYWDKYKMNLSAVYGQVELIIKQEDFLINKQRLLERLKDKYEIIYNKTGYDF